MKKFRMRDLFLISLSVVLMFTAWAGYCRVLGIQKRILSDTNSDLSLILGYTPKFPKPTLHHFLSGAFQTRMEKATRDSIAFLEQIIPFLTYWKSLVYELSLKVLPKSWSPVLPVGGKDYMRIRGKGQLLQTPRVYNPEIVKNMCKVANYYNRIAIRWPEVRFYVYAIPEKEQVFAETGAWPVTPTQLLLGSKAVGQFEALLLNSVAYGWAGKGRPAGEVLGFYYNTDHHLTMPGVYEAYRQLHHLIFARGVDIGQVIQCKNWFVVPNVIFRGSRSRLSGGYGGATDKLVDGLFALPHYHVTIHGSAYGQRRNKRLEYEAGKISSSRFFDHYGEYFGNSPGLIEYVVDQVSEGRNLLAIGDSFKNPMEPLLAAHFCRSYFVDLRHFANEVGHRFDLDLFISQNGITDVLFIGGEWWTVMWDPEMGPAAQERAD
jgi:hypothetical protein